jgi:hypothetical protein
MSVGVKASAIALAALACLLLAPAAMASTRPVQLARPVQLTGTQLRAALLPASDFAVGYTSTDESDSGRHLEHATVFHLRSTSCTTFWLFSGQVAGFGETAFATNLVEDKTGRLNSQETFVQSIYQFASTRAAASFYGQLMGKYRSCPSAGEPGGSGKVIRETLHSTSALLVGGHEASQVIEYVTASDTPGPPLVFYLLWTIDGTDVYWISTNPEFGAPEPTQTSLTLKLIARVGALGNPRTAKYRRKLSDLARPSYAQAPLTNSRARVYIKGHRANHAETGGVRQFRG